EEVDRLTRQIDYGEGFHGIIGKSPAMQKVFNLLEKSAKSDAPVIIYGESGTGKELAAQAIHELGPRQKAPFIQFNCAALNESLIESELFGHAKGAFTGAYRHHIGRFEAANGGDIFLDEIGDVPPSIQVKLLRVIEARQVERVGDHAPINVDVRIIMATNRNLEALVDEKKFREDLFFRINVIPIHLPPLRERREDIPLLVRAFIDTICNKTGKRITGLSKTAMQQVMEYAWPGNVRELKSALDYAFIVAEDCIIQPDDLPVNIQAATVSGERLFGPTGIGSADESGWAARGSGGALREPEEKIALIEALRQTGGNQTRAASLLGINRVTVWNRMRKYGINLEKALKV
ncbi:MAG: sigma-54-dependent Fis family transcriptional regulator, partial [Desulfobacterales bacterium]|nr:sigma-54-dependent Fis family transcriptional regulator [Desulfobacterales bacterium]